MKKVTTILGVILFSCFGTLTTFLIGSDTTNEGRCISAFGEGYSWLGDDVNSKQPICGNGQETKIITSN